MDFVAFLGDGPEAFLSMGLPLAVGLLLIVAFGGKGARRQMSRRIDRIKVHHGPRQTPIQIINARRSKKSGDMRVLDELVKKVLPQQEVLRLRLTRADLDITLGIYVLICLLVAGLGFVAATLTGFMPGIAALLFGVLCGLGLPHMFVGMRFKRRQNKFIAYFPEAIDLMVRGVKAGLPITESIKTAGDEIPDPVGTELKRITDGVRLGRKLAEVLWESAVRLDLQEFKFFTIALSIQAETGGNLAETLNNLAEVLRGRRQLKRKVKALSSEAKASAYIIGSLPFVMTLLIYLVNPGYIVGLVTDIRGQILIGFGLLMIGAGVGVMYRMVKFEI